MHQSYCSLALTHQYIHVIMYVIGIMLPCYHCTAIISEHLESESESEVEVMTNDILKLIIFKKIFYLESDFLCVWGQSVVFHHWNGKVVMMTTLLVAGDVEGKLQCPQWWPGQSPWQPFHFCDLCPSCAICCCLIYYTIQLWCAFMLRWHVVFFRKFISNMYTISGVCHAPPSLSWLSPGVLRCQAWQKLWCFRDRWPLIFIVLRDDRSTGLGPCNTGLILGFRPANERRRYFVTLSLIGWMQTKNQPWNMVMGRAVSTRSIYKYALRAINHMEARRCLNHWGWDKVAAIFQTTFWNGFFWMKIYKFQVKF